MGRLEIMTTSNISATRGSLKFWPAMIMAAAMFGWPQLSDSIRRAAARGPPSSQPPKVARAMNSAAAAKASPLEIS